MKYILLEDGTDRRYRLTRERYLTCEQEDGSFLFLLKLNTGATIESLERWKQDFDVQRVELLENFDEYFHVFISCPFESVKDLIKKSSEHPGIAFIEPCTELSIDLHEALTNDTFYHLQWPFLNTGQHDGLSGEDIKLEDAFTFLREKVDQEGLEFSMITIAVIDDGVDLNHDDIQYNQFEGIDFVDLDMEPEHVEELTHGTQVAGVIAAMSNNQEGIAGITPTCHLLGIKVIGKGNPKAEVLAHGIRHAAQKGARVINLSWGVSHYSQRARMISDAIDEVTQLGVIVVASVGNYLTTDDPKHVKFPASLPNTLGVGACDMRGRWINLRNCRETLKDAGGYGNPKFGSCYGDEVDIIAPGLLIPTAANNDPDNNYMLEYDLHFHGTSAAAAIVSGVIGLMLAVNPLLSRDEVLDIVKETADKLPEEGNGERVGTQHYGHGRINAKECIVRAYQLRIEDNNE